ncbi:MAG: hypothetical protein WCX65_09895 [bacterium]
MILWVDDDLSLTLKSFMDELKENGYEIIMVTNPDDISDKFAQYNITGIIMDIMLPTGQSISNEDSKMGILTGLEILKKLKEDKTTSQIPIVIFTILSNQDVSTWARVNNIKLLKKEQTVPLDLLAAVIETQMKKDTND